MSPLTSFLDFLKQYVTFSASEEQLLEQQLEVKYFPKGTVLLEEGKRSEAFYFLIQGCVRMYYLVDGVEKNTFFYTEQQFVSSYESFVRGTPATHFIACLEDSQMVAIKRDAAFALLEASSKFEQLSRMIMEEELIIYQQMLSAFVTLNAEQRYQRFLDQQAALAQRIPQYHLASYLGVSPETLSRIRSRLSLS